MDEIANFLFLCTNDAVAHEKKRRKRKTVRWIDTEEKEIISDVSTLKKNFKKKAEKKKKRKKKKKRDRQGSTKV